MGLDIRAYSNITPTDESVSEDDFQGFYSDTHNDFIERLAPLVNGVRYDGDDELHFRAGSYRGFNNWREQLAKLAGYSASGADERHQHSQGAWNLSGGKFWELIHFSDCDGCIGSVAAKKLLSDFEGTDVSDQDDFFKTIYENFKRACRIASNNGAIYFG